MKKNKLLLLMGILILISLVSASQYFTYYVEDGSIYLLELISEKNDVAFRFNEESKFDCLESSLQGTNLSGNISDIKIKMNVREIDCEDLSMYSLAKFIRDKKSDFEVIYGENSEYQAAWAISSFFNISEIKSDEGDINFEKNLIVVGNSNYNKITKELIGEWNYSTENPIIKIIEKDNEPLRVIIAGNSGEGTYLAVGSFIVLVYNLDELKSSSDCVIITGCEKPFSEADIDFDGIVSSYELLKFIDRFENLEISFNQLLDAKSKWDSV